MINQTAGSAPRTPMSGPSLSTAALVNAREPEVHAYLRYLDESLIELSNLNADLENRLSPVLREDDSKCFEGDAPYPNVPALARRLHDADRSLRHEIQRIRNILSCLEI